MRGRTAGGRGDIEEEAFFPAVGIFDISKKHYRGGADERGEHRLNGHARGMANRALPLVVAAVLLVAGMRVVLYRRMKDLVGGRRNHVDRDEEDRGTPCE